jgi:hypothetical protein
MSDFGKTAAYNVLLGLPSLLLLFYIVFGRLPGRNALINAGIFAVAYLVLSAFPHYGRLIAGGILAVIVLIFVGFWASS